MKEIILSQGKTALVDDSDYDRISQHKWYAKRNTSGGAFYALRKYRIPGTVTLGTVYMHREILGVTRDSNLFVDHRDPEQTLDNRRLNLRVATCSQNCAHTRRHKPNRSGFRGVQLRGNRWRAFITCQGHRLSLGSFGTAREAAKVYNEAAESLFGEFAYLNPL